jgi:hypothetical protein
MRLLPNGNVEITVQLLPEAYAALRAIMERDKVNEATAINAAIQVFEHISKMGEAAGTPLSAEDPA